YRLLQELGNVFVQAGRPTKSDPRNILIVFDSRFVESRNVWQEFQALRGGYRQRTQGSGLDLSVGGRYRQESGIDLPRNKVAGKSASAFIGYVHHFYAGFRFQQDAGQVQGTACSRGAVVNGSRCVFS